MDLSVKKLPAPVPHDLPQDLPQDLSVKPPRVSPKGLDAGHDLSLKALRIPRQRDAGQNFGIKPHRTTSKDRESITDLSVRQHRTTPKDRDSITDLNIRQHRTTHKDRDSITDLNIRQHRATPKDRDSITDLTIRQHLLSNDGLPSRDFGIKQRTGRDPESGSHKKGGGLSHGLGVQTNGALSVSLGSSLFGDEKLAVLSGDLSPKNRATGAGPGLALGLFAGQRPGSFSPDVKVKDPVTQGVLNSLLFGVQTPVTLAPKGPVDLKVSKKVREYHSKRDLNLSSTTLADQTLRTLAHQKARTLAVQDRITTAVDLKSRALIVPKRSALVVPNIRNRHKNNGARGSVKKTSTGGGSDLARLISEKRTQPDKARLVAAEEQPLPGNEQHLGLDLSAKSSSSASTPTPTQVPSRPHPHSVYSAVSPTQQAVSVSVIQPASNNRRSSSSPLSEEEEEEEEEEEVSPKRRRKQFCPRKRIKLDAYIPAEADPAYLLSEEFLDKVTAAAHNGELSKGLDAYFGKNNTSEHEPGLEDLTTTEEARRPEQRRSSHFGHHHNSSPGEDNNNSGDEATNGIPSSPGSPDDDSGSHSTTPASGSNKRIKGRSSSSSSSASHLAASLQNREQRKELRLYGKQYTTPSGKTYPQRGIRPKDCSKCRYNCSSNISVAQRQAIFQHFWSLDSYVKRLYYYCQSIKEKPAKTMKHTRECSREYTFLNEGQRVRVCKGFYLATLDVSDKAVRIAMEKRKRGKGMWDKRGTHPPHNKTRPEDKDRVRNHIESFLIIDIYTKTCANSPTLPGQDLNVTKMHHDYSALCAEEDREPVSEDVYRKTFNTEYNLSGVQV